MSLEIPGLNGSLSFTYTLSPQNRSAFVVLYLAQYLATIKVLTPYWPAIILFGFTTNFVNIVVLVKSGAKDNVGIFFFISLAVSDLTFLALITPTVCGFFYSCFFRSHSWPFDFQIISYLIYWSAFTAYDLSTHISVSLGVMRGHSSQVVFLVVLTVSSRMPVLSIHSISWKTDPSTNKSVPYLLARNFVSMSQINDI